MLRLTSMLTPHHLMPDESVMAQRYGFYGEWKDSDSCTSGQTAFSSQQHQMLDSVAQIDAPSRSDGDEAGDANEIEGFLDASGIWLPFPKVHNHNIPFTVYTAARYAKAR